MNPKFGAIVQDMTNDVGLVLGQNGNQTLALWEASGQVLSVFSDTITRCLGSIDSSELLLVGKPKSGFLGVSNQGFEHILRWAPKFPAPYRRFRHSSFFVLDRGEEKLPHLTVALCEEFNGLCSMSDIVARLKRVTEALHSRMSIIVEQEYKKRMLGALDAAAIRILSPEGHKAYTSAKRGIVLSGEAFKQLSEEQRLAVAATTLPTLVIARAGTGKTTTLVARACALIKDFGVAPEEILILAFNKKAALEVTERLEQQFPGQSIPTALTFHALAYQIVRPTTSPLIDEEGPDGNKELSKYIDGIIRANWNPHFEACIYKILTNSSLEQWLENGLQNTSDETYLRYRLNLPHYTLRAERVKSRGEKVIADYYARHGIGYLYEKAWAWDGRWYFPDFTILHQGRQVVHEHWGISLNSGNRTVPDYWTKSYEDYRTDIDRKRHFWRDRDIPLIETSIDDHKEGDEALRAVIARNLNELGLSHTRLSDKELLKQIVPLQKNRIRTLFASFINRMKSDGHCVSSIWKKIKSCRSDATIEEVLNICTLIFTKFQDRLAADHRYDFNDLLNQAFQRLTENPRSCHQIRNQKYRLDLSKIRYMMIDEFQDFNLQFFNLTNAIDSLNPGMNIFCVGDDWQAINAFMGADTKYFHGFHQTYDRAMELSISITRRCPKSLVRHSNELMKVTGGTPVLPLKEDSSIPIRIEKMPENINILVRKIVEVIRKCGRSKSYAVLFRTNTFGGREIEEIYRKVEHTYTKSADEPWMFNGKRIALSISTVHRFKGKEADVVFLADASMHSYPLIHPDCVFFEAFGDTPEKLLLDERRLFYVALTRAKEQLWLFYDGNIGPSPFIKDAQLSLERCKARAEAEAKLDFIRKHRFESITERLAALSLIRK